MTRKFTLGGKPPQTGNNVAHSHLKTARQWMPNIQTKTLYSAALGRFVRMTIATETMRSVDRAGGLDEYLKKISEETLNRPMRNLKRQIMATSQTPAS